MKNLQNKKGGGNKEGASDRCEFATCLIRSFPLQPSAWCRRHDWIVSICAQGGNEKGRVNVAVVTGLVGAGPKSQSSLVPTSCAASLLLENLNQDLGMI